MHIIGINGIRCRQNALWDTLVPAFKKRYAGTTFVVKEDSGMDWYQLRRQRRFIDYLQDRYDQNGHELILIGHSLGGVFATALANRLRKATLKGLVTICAPNAPVWIYPMIHGARGEVLAPTVSVSGFCDRVVWRGTKHPDAREHLVLDCDHYWRLVDNTQHAETIADAAARHIT